MRWFYVLVMLLGTARADDRKEEFRLRDVARHAVADAINANDAKTVATYVDKQLETKDLWLDTPACRKQFSNAKITQKQLPAFVACMSPLGFDARTMLERYGPDVLVRLEWVYANGKTTLVSMKGDSGTSKEYPTVWSSAFEKHRKAGDKTIAFDDKARAEIEESDAGGAIYVVCVDANGDVASITPKMVDAKGPTARALKVAAKSWKFEPFLVRGKPAMACAEEIQKL